jgi:transposase/Tfp pilus assembly protein PilF
LLAYHYARGGIQDRAVQYLELAGDHAWAQRAHGAAERHYREVVDRLEAMGCAREAVHVREKLGEVLYRAGRYDAAIRVLEPAAEAFHAAGDEESLGRVTTWMGRAHGLRGTPHEGVALITALLEPLDRGDAAPPLARLYLELGRLLFTAGQYNASLAASERAADVARAGGDDHTRVLAERDRANILAKLGRLGDALCLGQKVLPLIETMGDLDRLLVTHRDLAYIHALQGAFAPCQRHIDRALGLAGQMGEPGPIASTLAVRGWFALLRGEWQGARADLDQAVELSRQVDRSWHLAYVLICRARLSLAEGAWADAAALVQEAIALAERSGDLQALRWASTVMAEIDVLAGRPEAATARLFPLLDRPGLEECDVTQLLPVLAWAYLEQGQVEQAVAPVGQALVRARREEMRLVVVEALRVQTLIALPHEQWTEAARSLEEGLALARSMPYPYAEARLLHVYGRLHIQKGEPQAARERLEAARAIFARLGAPTDTAQVEQALAGLSQKQGSSETGLTDAQWAQIEALLPPRPRRRGRPRADDRRTLAAILYVQRTGCAWADLPADLGDEATAHRRWQEWQAAGLWERIAAILQATSPGVKGHERTAGTGACTPPEGGLLPSRARPADF